jgi:Protein of unknown function (DUF1592)/Protein of unknown function (DUF1588)/Protein of unknown function (DUF1595)/Protein of unknown function (DUF1587)
MKMSTRFLQGAFSAALAVAGCTGNVIEPDYVVRGNGNTNGMPNPNGPTSPAGTGGTQGNAPAMAPMERPAVPGPGVKPPGSAVRCENEVVTQRVLRRLTNGELETTIRAAFGFDQATWKTPSLIPDPASGDGFTNNTDRLSVGDEYANRLMEAGRDLADLVTSDAHLARILPCAAAGGDPCANTFLDSVGAKLFKRPLTPAEKARYTGLVAKVKTGGGDFKTWVYWTTIALVKSPNTVYRSELGEPIAGGKFKLSPYEVASSLSYAYTGGPPTPELLQLAAANRLSTADDLEMAAKALVYGPDGQVRPAVKNQLLRFADQWLGLSPLANINKDKTLYPDFTPEVQDALAEEIRRYLSAVWFDDKGKPADLMTAPFTFVNATLSKFYGFGQAAGADFVKTPRPAKWGSGLMAQGAILNIAAANNSTSPTKRGHLVRERFLCTTVPPPPKAVAPIPEPTAAQTTRQRYEQIHVAADECKGCHALMDPIGFGLEHLNATGRYQEKEGAFDIDDRGSLTNTSLGDITFKGSDELAQALAKLPEVADCMADFASAYTFGLNHQGAACIAKGAGDDLRTGKIGFVDFMVGMARAESFRTRVP